MLKKVGSAISFLGKVWRLALPYWRSEERWRARLLLAVVVGLTLGMVFILVRVNDWYRRFYNALETKDFSQFWPLLLEFGVLATIYIAAAVYKLYLRQMLEIRWRTWLTQRFLGSWLDRQIYYRLELKDNRTDNPDQRISEDLRLFTTGTLVLALDLLSSVVTLVSFITVLWVVSGPLDFSVGTLAVSIPGYMVWVAIVYAIVGSLLTHYVGRPLIRLNFMQERYEADFRFSLVRLRENAESVAFYRGEQPEQANLQARFERVRSNWRGLMEYTKRLTGFTVGYSQVAIIFPVLVAAPRYFAGAITLGDLIQIGNAFGQVQGSLSWFVESYGSLADWKASVDRLLTFQHALQQTASELERAPGIEISHDGAGAIRVEDLDLLLPSGETILANTALSIERGDRLVVVGPSGSGKTTLFRAIAGIWPFGRGRIVIPANARLMFLPQKPYIPIASLRDAVTYPAPPGSFTDQEVREALRAVKLEDFEDRLEEVQNWAMAMSVGEQQRLAFARALLHRPEWLFLDEATAALDEATERYLYQVLAERLPGATIVSIAHRPGVRQYHARVFAVAGDGTPAEVPTA